MSRSCTRACVWGEGTEKPQVPGDAQVRVASHPEHPESHMKGK